MLKIDIWPEAEVFLETLSDKYKKQIVAKLFLLANVPFPIQSKQLTGFAPFRRFPSGNFRIVYFVDGNILKVPLIGRRNDNKVYRHLKNLFK